LQTVKKGMVIIMLKDVFQTYPWLKDKQSQVVSQCIGDDFKEGAVSCGFMRKRGAMDSQYQFKLNFYSCFVVLSGSGTYYDSRGKQYRIEPGCLVQRFPGEVHTTEVNDGEDWLEFFINLGTKTYDFMKNMNMLPCESPVKPVILAPEFMNEVIDIIDKMNASTKEDAPYLLLELQKIVYLLQNSNLYSKSTELEKTMEQACLLLGKDLKEEIHMEEIAESVSMGYESFRKIFKQHHGVSPMQYRTNSRIQQAKMMLLSGVTIKQTAELVGYSDYFAFAKQFKHTVGVSPAEFRKSAGTKKSW
jgi:AraC family transcriptional regulator, arabinose operon regulatory protein